MNNRQSKAQDKANPPISSVIEHTNGAVLTGEFSFMFGSAGWEKFNEFVMQKAGTYFFAAALVMNIIKLVIAAYRFYKERNKNISEYTGLAYVLAQTGLIAVAIIGGLVATALFATITPILFTAAMGMDFVRNLGLLGWNIFKRIQLAVSTSEEAYRDPLIKMKYKKLRNKYNENIENHSIGALISALMTLATVVNFLLPHLGATTAGIAAAAITIGSFKTTVAGMTGILAGAGLVVTFLKPVIDWGIRKIKSPLVKGWSIVKGLFSKMVTQPEEQAPLLQEQVIPLPRSPKPRKIFINDNDELNINLAKKLPHHAAFLHSEDRELVIRGIATKELAQTAIIRMANDKINAIQEQINREEGTWFVSAARQLAKREEKIKALTAIRDFMSGREVKSERDDPVTNAASLVAFIKKAYPEVDSSAWRNESDTRNILNAVVEYVKVFEAQPQARDAEVAVERPVLS